jgi:hypothetical protein
VLLERNAKKPVVYRRGDGWPLTRDVDLMRYWVIERGGNVGLMAGEAFGLAIIDVDDSIAFAELEVQLGPLGAPSVITARGKPHYYVAWAPGIPATLTTPDGSIVVGEPRRGGYTTGQTPPPWQQAVCPPSRIDGRAYRFVNDAALTGPLPSIPPRWRAYFATMSPSETRNRRAAATTTPTTAGTARQLHVLETALRQPGARARGSDVKFQCPACAEAGRDTSQDNARLFASGAWGCAVYPRGVPGGREHWRRIGEVLGALKPRRSTFVVKVTVE